MIRFYVLLCLAIAVLGAACGGNPVGRICDLGTQGTCSVHTNMSCMQSSQCPMGETCNSLPEPSEVVVASPSLDCVTRTCLRVPLAKDLPPGSTYPSGTNGLCTAECSSAGDCDRVPESPCKTGFTCGIAVTVGPFCCRRFCICKDYVVLPDNGVPTDPMACDAGDANNACCNLAGRTNNAMYPNCKT